jgi:excisionase family DNA binding protein
LATYLPQEGLPMTDVVGRGIEGWAESMGWSPASIRRAIARGELGFTRLGRRIIIPTGEMEKFLAARTGKKPNHPVAPKKGSDVSD